MRGFFRKAIPGMIASAGPQLLIVGGAIGNVVDRLHYGYVIDFIDFYRIWPNIFNVADSCITVGVGLLLLSSLVARRHG